MKQNEETTEVTIKLSAASYRLLAALAKLDDSTPEKFIAEIVESEMPDIVEQARFAADHAVDAALHDEIIQAGQALEEAWDWED